MTVTALLLVNTTVRWRGYTRAHPLTVTVVVLRLENKTLWWKSLVDVEDQPITVGPLVACENHGLMIVAMLLCKEIEFACTWKIICEVQIGMIYFIG